MDTLTVQERSARMALVRSKNTKPEILVRQLVHSMGYRYRLHRRGLPGTPDLVFPGRSKIIFIHGCFWHRHAGCALARLPKSRTDFWLLKLTRNAERDARDARALRRLGWGVLTVWECQLRDDTSLTKRIGRFLDA